MKYKIEIDDEAVDSLVVKNLQQAYEECVDTMLDTAKQVFDPLEDVIRRQAAIAEVLAYYMAPREFGDYIRIWNNKVMEAAFNHDKKDQDS
jgi:cytochrome c2